MTEAASGGAKVLWVGQPPMASPTRTAQMANLDGIFEAQAKKNPAVTYVPSNTVLGTPLQHQYTAYLNVKGQQVQIRTTDGIHLAPAGDELLSQAVIAAMRTDLGIALPPG